MTWSSILPNPVRVWRNTNKKILLVLLLEGVIVGFALAKLSNDYHWSETRAMFWFGGAMTFIIAFSMTPILILEQVITDETKLQDACRRLISGDTDDDWLAVPREPLYEIRDLMNKGQA